MTTCSHPEVTQYGLLNGKPLWVCATCDRAVPTCAWFAGCKRPATLVVEHPVLDWVPVCGRCDDALDLDGIEAEWNKPTDSVITEWVQ